ncbi:hypothetical protein EJ03DRAFT_98078 [Teratosphaeria nubilosa]|uniref:Glycoside hydrolase n=1 Tax=Teratosphaeria nubilosa TaxID=161662 RepID=A0A6G1L9H8_9PEZI|nr:hypothetical protein EJ03DRAFT_98078 [Teratosphaeria nubilosa]
MLGITVALAVFLASFAYSKFPEFNNPPTVDICCGKAYRASNDSFNPGGWFVEPPISTTPLLNFKVAPKKSLYLDGETSGSLLVEVSISDQVGQALPSDYSYSKASDTADLTLDIIYYIEGSATVIGSSTALGVGGSLVQSFDLCAIPASLTAYTVAAVATLKGCNTIYYASTQITKLPAPPDKRTVTRIDNQYGGLEYLKAGSNTWQSIFPYTYYSQWTLYWYANISTLDEFASMGYNVIHVVPTGDLGKTPFPYTEFAPYLDRADELGLLFQFDVRWDYEDLSLMNEIVTTYASHPSILLWYTGDEPDGKSNPINSTGLAYDSIRSIDLYHPVSLTLTCYDFFYSSYAAGAEIILSDVYPIATNTSYTTVYNTPCNATYGCCGCDDCNGSFTDLSNRLDEFKHFDEVLGWQKTHWGVPQAFGNETFWTRYPTAAEEVVMNMISLNHRAKGLVLWDFPSTAEIVSVTDKLAKVLTSEEVTAYLTSTPLISSVVVKGASDIDAAVWIGESGLLLSVINLNYGNVNGCVNVHLPAGVTAKAVQKTFWGTVEWSVSESGSTISTNFLMGLEASMVVLDV